MVHLGVGPWGHLPNVSSPSRISCLVPGTRVQGTHGGSPLGIQGPNFRSRFPLLPVAKQPGQVPAHTLRKALGLLTVSRPRGSSCRRSWGADLPEAGWVLEAQSPAD